MGVRIQVARCGRCGKPRGLTHTCIVRMDVNRKPGRTQLAPRLTVICGRCGKPRGLTHTCITRTDFAQRKAAAARRQAAQAKRRKAAERRAVLRARQRQAAARRRAAAAAKRKAAAEWRKAAKTAARPTPAATTKPAHDYRTCQDRECRRYACQAWKQALDEGHTSGLDDGYQLGYQAGFADGRAAATRQRPR
jgi:hypothetical protein